MLYNRDGLETLSFTTSLFTGCAKGTHLQNEDVEKACKTVILYDQHSNC